MVGDGDALGFFDGVGDDVLVAEGDGLELGDDEGAGVGLGEVVGAGDVALGVGVGESEADGSADGDGLAFAGTAAVSTTVPAEEAAVSAGAAAAIATPVPAEQLMAAAAPAVTMPRTGRARSGERRDRLVPEGRASAHPAASPGGIAATGGACGLSWPAPSVISPPGSTSRTYDLSAALTGI